MTTEIISKCCGAPIYYADFCSDCKEHTGQEIDGYQEYLNAIREWAVALEKVAKSADEMNKLVSETRTNVNNLQVEINKRIK